LLKAYLTVNEVALVLGAGSLVWAVSGKALRGWHLIAWMLVPLLITLAGIAVAGPGRLFSKERYEGDALIEVSRSSAVTTLDLLGLVIFAAAIQLAIALVYMRFKRA
jgi:hypothetical protein